MRQVRAWFIRLKGLFYKTKTNRDLADEIETNLEFQIEDNIRAGMTSAEARRAALLKFGSLEAAKEEVRDRRGIPFLETLARDITYAFRMLRQSKGWSAVAILSLALGIGANSALFSLVNNYAVEKLPVKNPEELVVFRWYGENTVRSLTSGDSYVEHSQNEPAGADFSFDAFQRFRNSNQTLTDIFAFADVYLNVFVNGQAEFATGQYVSGDFYSALRIQPALGRMISDGDDAPSSDPVVVISHQYWERRFARDPRVIGSTITINNTSFTVSGVSPARVRDLTKRGSVNAPEITIPLAFEPRMRQGGSWMKFPQNWWLIVMGRLKPGINATQAQASFAGIWDQAARDGWNTWVASMNPETKANPRFGGRKPIIPRLRIVSASRGVSDARKVIFDELAILTAIFSIVLLIVCVNLANLLLSRAASRQKEIAVRLAIGASRLRVIRQLLTESLLMAGIGGAAGLVFAVWCSRLLSGVVFRIDRFSPYSYQAPKINFAVLLFAGALTLATGLLFGIVPAIRATQVDCSPAIREAEAKFSASRSRLGKALLVTQVALSLVLLVGAGLCLRTLRNLQQVNLGFNPNNIALFSVQPGLSGYTRATSPALYEQMEQRLLTVPGIRSATFAAPEGLLAFGETHYNLFLDGPGQEPVQREAAVVSIHPNFFETMEIPLKLGRSFTNSDTQTSQPVAVVNETLAKAFFPNENSIGKRFAGGPNVPWERRIEIVGVVADAKVNSLRDDSPAMFYRPLLQLGFPSRTVVVRAAGDPAALLPAIQNAVREIDPRLPLGQLSTEMERLEGSYLNNERTFAFASSFFGGLALTVASIGLFGLMSYSVARRTKEIGIRMALGAEREKVLRSVMREAISLVAIGIGIGLIGALVLTRLISSLLFGLAPHDPLTISIAALLMVLVSAIAAYLPARRAANVDPMVALRYE